MAAVEQGEMDARGRTLCGVGRGTHGHVWTCACQRITCRAGPPLPLELEFAAARAKIVFVDPRTRDSTRVFLLLATAHVNERFEPTVTLRHRRVIRINGLR